MKVARYECMLVMPCLYLVEIMNGLIRKEKVHLHSSHKYDYDYGNTNLC